MTDHGSIHGSMLFHVPSALAGQTLSAVLRCWRSGESWSQIRGLVRSRRVMISGNLCEDANRRLRAADVVKILPHPSAPPPRDEDVLIRYLDEHLVVVEKPSGMTSIRHPEERSWPARRRQSQPTLDEILPRIVARRERKGNSPLKSRAVRAVHRLDRETSGLMVFARTKVAEKALGDQFRRHTVHRVYWAIACGRVEAQTIETRLVADRGDGRRGSTKTSDLGKRAITHVRPLEHLAGFTVVQCRLETGRTHQIRIHLAELAHPICGEKVYHRPRFGVSTGDRSAAPRLALHAAELGFKHAILGEELRFEMPLPADLCSLLARLRQVEGSQTG